MRGKTAQAPKVRVGYIGGHETRNRHRIAAGGGPGPGRPRRGTGGRSAHGENRQDRRGVAGIADARAVPRDSAAGHGARLHGGVPRPPRAGHLPLRMLRSAAVFVGRQVRVGHGLAELFPAGGGGASGAAGGPRLRHGAHGGALRAVRRAPGARVRRWTAADGAALLHQFRRAALRAGGAAGQVRRAGGAALRGEKRRFLSDSGGAKTKPRLFRADASRPTARGHESCSGRPRNVLIGKSAASFRVKSRRNPKEIPGPHVLRTAGKHGAWKMAVENDRGVWAKPWDRAMNIGRRGFRRWSRGGRGC